MSEDPLYVSPCSGTSLWQEYRIYDDRIEFQTLLGTLLVPMGEIESVAVRESDVKGLVLHGDLQLKGFRPALKLDWANFVEHVVLDKSGGLIHRLLFTPDNPAMFVAALEEALARWRDHQAESAR
jgi:hypothetical protein